MNGTFHLTSVLLDKGTVREALRGIVRAEMGMLPTLLTPEALLELLFA